MSTRYIWEILSSEHYESRFSATEPGKYGQSISTVSPDDLSSAGLNFIQFGTGFKFDVSTGTYSLTDSTTYDAFLNNTTLSNGEKETRIPVYSPGSYSGYGKGPKYQFILSNDRKTLYYAAIDPYRISLGNFDSDKDSAYWRMYGNIYQDDYGIKLYQHDGNSTNPSESGQTSAINFYKFSSVSGGESTGYITSSDRNAYSGSNYSYYGSDNPDIKGISYSGENLKPRDKIQVTINEAESDDYLLHYVPYYPTGVLQTWQVNINGNGWQNWKAERDPSMRGGTSTFSYTIPENARSLQFRAYAWDNAGWTGDYVTGPVVYIDGATTGKVWVGVNNTARQVANVWVGVNGTARKVTAMWVGVNGVAKKVF